MLNNFLNSQIQNNVNHLNKLNYINNQKFKKRLPQKYQPVNIDKINFFKKSNNVQIYDEKLVQNSDNSKLNNVLNEHYNNNGPEIVNNDKKLGNFIDTFSTLNSNVQTLDFIDLMNESIDGSNGNIIIKLNKNIKTINNVYKISFKNSESSGFGDFIRGCYFLLEFCEKNNVNVDFHIYDSHIKLYLNYFVNKPNVNDFIASNVERYMESNHEFTNIDGIINYEIKNENDNEFMKYLNNCKCYLNHIFINTINFPSHNISQKHITVMKNLLQPTNFLKVEINNLLQNLQLDEKKFTIYHIRLGDDYLDDQNTLINVNILNKIIEKIKVEYDHNYLLISDSLVIKNLIKKLFPNIKIINNTFSHTVKNNNNDIKNTLIDFYLMSYSKQIVSFSVYPHGSGFSKWCSITYEIPYVCYSLI